MYRLSRLLLIVSALAGLLCLIAIAYQVPQGALLAGIVCLCVAAGQRGYATLSGYGTRRWADEEDLRRAGMLDAKEGIMLGRLGSRQRRSLMKAMRALFNPRLDSKLACWQFFRALPIRQRSAKEMVRLVRSVHTAVFAPTGVGKGASFVIPFLLTSPDSAVVIDFKGELTRATAEHRREKFGHRVVILDPFCCVTQHPDSFNPIDWIDKASPQSIDECRDLADAIVIRTGQEKDPHWNDAATIWIASMAAAVVMFGEAGDRSLQTTRRLLTDPQQMEGVVKLLCESDAWGGLLARLGHQLSHFKDKELASVLTTVNRGTCGFSILRRWRKARRPAVSIRRNCGKGG